MGPIGWTETSVISVDDKGNYTHRDNGVIYRATCTFATKMTRVIEWSQASAAKWMRTALFWVITQLVVVISYRRFGTTYRSHLQGLRIEKKTRKIGAIGYTETSELNYHYLPRNDPEYFGSHIEQQSLSLPKNDLHQTTSAHYLCSTAGGPVGEVPSETALAFPMKMTVLWIVTTCRVVQNYRHHAGTNGIRIKGRTLGWK
jgi:hypothetical protein